MRKVNQQDMTVTMRLSLSIRWTDPGNSLKNRVDKSHQLTYSSIDKDAGRVRGVQAPRSEETRRLPARHLDAMYVKLGVCLVRYFLKSRVAFQFPALTCSTPTPTLAKHFSTRLRSTLEASATASSAPTATPPCSSTSTARWTLKTIPWTDTRN